MGSHSVQVQYGLTDSTAASLSTEENDEPTKALLGFGNILSHNTRPSNKQEKKINTSFAFILPILNLDHQIMSSLGNPAPLGLLAFGMTTMLLMYVETGWVENDFTTMVYGYAVFYGGVCQFLVGIFEIIKGSSFSFAVFGSYGAFWLGWAIVTVEKYRNTAFGDATYPGGKAAFFAQWGILSCCFFVITLRKNICLIVVFGLLSITFFLLAAGAKSGNERVTHAAGYFGFFTAVGAFYTGVAELVNEEWGRHVLPGICPLRTPERLAITKATILKLTTYDKKTNSLFLQFSGLQINRPEDVEAIREGVMSAILDSEAPDSKVHVIADYKDVTIAKELEDAYWAMAKDLERKHYLSVRRFYVSSFGTRSGGPPRRETAIYVAPKQLASASEGKNEEAGTLHGSNYVTRFSDLEAQA